MSFWDLFKKKKDDKQYVYANYLDGNYPVFSQYGQSIYASDVVQQAMYSIITEIKKLDPIHVRKINGSEYSPVNGNIQSVLDNPNPLMTTCDFVEKIMWNLLLNYNSFVYPMWEGNTLVALYPLQPTSVEFLQDNSNSVYVKMRFNNGYETTIPYSDIIHIRHKYSVSEYMGGDINGQPDNSALLETLKINDILLKGLAKTLNLQTSINGIIKYKTMINTDDLLKRVKEFEDKLKSNQNGFLPLDISSEYTPINKQVQLLDSTTLEFLDKKILRSFGVSISIINGDYSKDQYEAFFQKTIKPIIKSLNQSFTRTLFTKREIGFENKILFSPEESIFYTNQEKIAIATLLVDTSSIYKNTLLRFLGFPALPEFEGQIAESSNKTNAENNKDKGGESNE